MRIIQANRNAVTKRVTRQGDTDGTNASPPNSGTAVIKRIELVNFMSHERTVIEPAPGLTVLVGPNNCGKSAFVSALQILCHNSKSSYVLRHGEKKCQIIVETDDGHVVEWAKTKTGSPHYLIDGEKHDRLRGGVPDQVHQILGLPKVECEKDQFDIHFGQQKDPVFLLNDSGKASAQFFASSSDAIRLVEMQDRHKSKVRDSKREIKRLTSEKEAIEEAVELLEPMEELDQRLKALELEYKSLLTNQEAIESAEIQIRAIENLEKEIEGHQRNLAVFKKLDSPPELADSNRLERLTSDLMRVSLFYTRSAATEKALQPISSPPKMEDVTRLADVGRRLENAQKVFKSSSGSAKVLSRLDRPPTIGDETRLSKLVTQLQLEKTKTELLQKKNSVFQRVASPPELTSNEGLVSILKEIKKSVTAIEKSSQQLQQTEIEIANVKLEIKSWVDEFPTCPTCGGGTSVDQLLEGGGHRHG